MLPISHDIFGVEFSIRYHLGESHHRGGVRTNRIGRNHIDIGVLGGLCRRDASVHTDRLLFCFGCSWHSSLRLDVYSAQPRTYPKYSSLLGPRDASTLPLAARPIPARSRRRYPSGPRPYRSRARARLPGSPWDTLRYTRGSLCSNRRESYTSRSNGPRARCTAPDKR